MKNGKVIISDISRDRFKAPEDNYPGQARDTLASPLYRGLMGLIGPIGESWKAAIAA